MSGLFQTLRLGAFIVLLLVVGHSPVFAQTAQTEVQASLDALSAWLSNSDYGQGWKDYLKTDQLRDQLNKGEDADIEVLEKQLELYSSNNPGLRKPRFADVREALQDWIDELQLPGEDKLPELAKEAAQEVEPVDPEQLQQARKRLESQAGQFESFLKRGGKVREEGWKEFLRWEELTEELEQDSPNRETLVQIWAIFAGDAVGLNYRQFVEFREALREYLELDEILADEENALSNLPNQLAAYRKNPTEQTAADLGLTLAWLERTNQAEEVVQGVRKQYALPNLFLDASEELVVYGFATDVDQTDPISNYSNGNSTSGTGHTTGKITAELTPNGSRGEVTVSMDGQINSRTRTSNNSGVTFNTNGITSIDATKAVYFTDDGIRDEPADARCVTDNVTYNIRANSAQVESIARQRIAERERSSEYQAARRAEQNVESDLNQRVREQTDEVNQRIRQDFLAPMERRGTSPRYNHAHSTEDRLFQRMILAAPEHLGAPSGPPEIKVEGDLIARVHASWLNNMADISLRGSLLTDKSVAEAFESWRGEVPEELQVTEDSEPWDITLAARRPLLVEVGKDRLTITLRGARFTARDRTLYEPMHISASYNVKRGDKITLVRDGDVKVTFPEQGDKLSVAYVSRRRFWQTKFSALFGEEFDNLNLDLRGAWESAGPLKLTALGTRPDGWVGLAWDMPDVAAE